MDIKNLKEKPLWQMTGEEFLYLQQSIGHPERPPYAVPDQSKKYVYGIRGIAGLFGCSLPTANRIKQSSRIDSHSQSHSGDSFLSGVFDFELGPGKDHPDNDPREKLRRKKKRGQSVS